MGPFYGYLNSFLEDLNGFGLVFRVDFELDGDDFPMTQGKRHVLSANLDIELEEKSLHMGQPNPSVNAAARL
jgi:hypothetical protein